MIQNSSELKGKTDSLTHAPFLHLSLKRKHWRTKLSTTSCLCPQTEALQTTTTKNLGKSKENNACIDLPLYSAELPLAYTVSWQQEAAIKCTSPGATAAVRGRECSWRQFNRILRHSSREKKGRQPDIQTPRELDASKMKCRDLQGQILRQTIWHKIMTSVISEERMKEERETDWQTPKGTDNLRMRWIKTQRVQWTHRQAHIPKRKLKSNASRQI